MDFDKVVEGNQKKYNLYKKPKYSNSKSKGHNK